MKIDSFYTFFNTHKLFLRNISSIEFDKRTTSDLHFDEKNNEFDINQHYISFDKKMFV